MHSPARPAVHDEPAFDRLLVRLQAYGSELANGLTSHAPMVVDALEHLGRLDAAAPWLDRYLPGALPRGGPAAALEPDDWQAALGRSELERRWFARFEADIAAAGWRASLPHWTERLAPGFAAAAAHGIIRTAHAARALARLDTAPRRMELAAGLALWASSWQALPGDPLASSGVLPARDALRAVPLVPRARRRNGGAITVALTVLAEEPEFAAALGRLDRARPADELTLDLATAFAHLFLEQVRTPLQAIVFTHAITGVVAVRRLAPLVGGAVTASLLAYGWQTGAALCACYAEPDAVEPVVAAPTVDALIATAVAHGDEHVIKLAEACIELHAATGDPVFLAAAARAGQAIPAG